MNPLVSIIVPCYNHAQYLPDALHSVLAQTYPHWECIVVNDGSTDNTREVATQFALQDPRMHLVNAPQNSGLAASRNLGIAHSRGEYLLPLDADDMLDARYLATTVPLLQHNQALKLVFTDTQCFGLKNELVRFRHFDLTALCHQNQLNCTALFRRSDYDQTEGYRLNMKYGYEDWDYWLQLLSDKQQIRHLPLPLLLVRTKQEAMHLSMTNDTKKEQAMRAQLRLNNLAFFSMNAAHKKPLLWRIYKHFKSRVGFYNPIKSQ